LACEGRYARSSKLSDYLHGGREERREDREDSTNLFPLIIKV